MQTTNLEQACKATTKQGDPCRTRPGTDGYCFVHSPSRTFSPHETGRKAGIKSGATRRKQGLSLRQRLSDELDREARKVVAVYLEAMEAEQVVAGKEGPIALGPDHALRVRAADSAINQAHGKPLQPVAQGGKTIVIVHPLISEAKTIQVDGDQVIELPADQVREIE